jgi:hypothetical protein
VTDQFRVVGTALDGEEKQFNYAALRYLYDSKIRSYTLKGEFFFTKEWQGNVYGSVNEASNFHKNNILYTENKKLFAPGATLKYNSSSANAYFIAVTGSMISKNYPKNKAVLINLTDLGMTYEKLFEKNRSIGVSGHYFLYDDHVHNRAFWLSNWEQVGIPCFEDMLTARYQVDYRRFKKEVSDYYTFNYQLTHWLKFRSFKEFDLFTMNVEYWRGWRWTKGINPNQPLTPFPFVGTTQTKVFTHINVVYYSLSNIIGDWLHWQFSGAGSKDSEDYVTWGMKGELTIVF